MDIGRAKAGFARGKVDRDKETEGLADLLVSLSTPKVHNILDILRLVRSREATCLRAPC